MLTAAVQPSGLCRPVHDRHQAHSWTGKRCRRRPLASTPSLRHHHTTHWPHCRTATTSSEHSWGQPPPYGSRHNRSPAPWSPSTATRLLGYLDRTFQVPYGSKCSSPPTICRTRATKQRRSWSGSVLCGQACRRIAATGRVLASPASAPKSPAMQLLHWATLPRRQPAFCAST
jgi:hypothetical protein